jgi:type III pantothenate kinase
MLWAIDVGNTNTVIGVWDGDWKAVWRLATDSQETEDELAVKLKGFADLSGLPFKADAVAVSSVVPRMDHDLERLANKWLHSEVFFLRNGDQVGLPVLYDPPHAVGADRIANAIGALAIAEPPLIVVDFGTATTFDCVSAEGAYVGGAILPGVVVSMEALYSRTAKLPQIPLEAPDRAIGRTTVTSIQSGIMLGYAGAIDALAEQISQELAGAKSVLVTGGLGNAFMSLCKRLDRYEPNLTLDGLRLCWERAQSISTGTP